MAGVAAAVGVGVGEMVVGAPAPLGAGTGAHSAAFVDELCGRAGMPAEVFVTAFLTRKAMLKYLDEISWEAEVRVAGSPDHLIRFNGERLPGPYE